MGYPTQQAGEGRFQWHPHRRILVFVALFLPLTISLGFWQLDRAAEKQVLLDESGTRQQAAPVLLEAVDFAASNQYRPVLATGSFDNAHHILLDNRVRRGQPGYEVITPFQLSATDRWILVNRGWVAATASRDELPQIADVTGQVTLQGHLYASPGKPFTLGEDQWRDTWPQIVQNLDPALVSGKLGVELTPLTLRLNEVSPAGYQVGWEVVNVQPQKHVAYAVQWFALAGALAILALFANSNLSALIGRNRRINPDD